jgi:hypothetical protein
MGRYNLKKPNDVVVKKQQLSAWSNVLLEKLMDAQLVK